MVKIEVHTQRFDIQFKNFKIRLNIKRNKITLKGVWSVGSIILNILHLPRMCLRLSQGASFTKAAFLCSQVHRIG